MKVSSPTRRAGRGKAFYFARTRRNGRCRSISTRRPEDALCSDCLKSGALSVFSLAVLRFALSLRFLRSLSGENDGAAKGVPRTTSPAKYYSRVFRCRRERTAVERIFRDTKGNVSRRSGLIIRFHEAEKGRRLSARGERHEQCSVAHLRLCSVERMEIALL